MTATASVRARRAAVDDAGGPVFWILLGGTLALLGVGLLMVLSASSVLSIRENGTAYSMAVRQIGFAVVGLLALYAAVRLPRRFWRGMATPILLGALALLVLVLVIGVEVGGQRNWIEIYGPLRIQPSEFAKLALVLWVPLILATRERSARTWSELLLPVALGAGAVIVLVLAEKDGGTPMVMAPIVLAMLWAAGAPKRVIAGAMAVGLLGIAALTVLEDYRMERITSWLDPWADPEGAGMQAVHGQLALGSGGLLGEGLGASKEKWGSLPAAHTDFILAVIGEEAGLLGTLGVLLAVTAIVWACLQVALRTDDPFARYVSVGVGAWIGVQSLVNMGAVIGALPITGVTLPLVSYGGSSLVPTLVALGIVLSFVRPPSLAWRPRGSARRATP